MKIADADEINLLLGQTSITRQLDQEINVDVPDIRIKTRPDRSAAANQVLNLNDLRNEAYRAREQYGQTIDHFEYVVTQLVSGRSFNVSVSRNLLETCHEMRERAMLTLNIAHDGDEYLYQRGVDVVAIISMTVAHTLAY